MKKILLSILTITAFGFGANAQLIPTNGLISHYSFNNNFNDSSGTNHGTNFGATFAADRHGNSNKALYLNGASAIVTFGDINITSPDFSISFWLNYDSIPAGKSAKVLSKRAVCSTGNFFDISLNPASIGMEVFSGSNNSANAAGSGTTTPNTWYHVVFVVDQTSQETRQYIDGVLSSTNSWSTTVGSIDNSASFGISNSPCIPANINTIAYKGFIDDIRVYTRSVNQTEVTSLFNEDKPVNVKEHSLNSKIDVYPNPTTSQLTLNTTEQIESINIVDITGKTVKMIIPTNNTIDVSDLTKGIYFLQVTTSNGIVNSKFIKE